MKKIFITSYIILSLLLPLTTLRAQVDTSNKELPPPPRAVFTNETFVFNLSVEKRDYKAGEEIKGTFTIKNASDNYLDNVQYLVYIAGNIDSSFNHTGYGEVYSSKFGLEGNEFKKIAFSFPVPDVLALGEKEIVVKSLHNGVPYGMAHAPLTIENALTPYVLQRGRIVVENEEYALSVGPTLYPDRPGYVKLAIVGSPESRTISPKVRLYRNAVSTGELIEEKELPVITTGTTTTDFSYSLPTTYAPGIYEAELSFIDENQNVRNRVIAHYIIGGNIATIRDISFLDSPLVKGETLVVSTTITGNPADIADDTNDKDTIPVTINVTLESKSGRVIGEATIEKEVGAVEKIEVPVSITKNTEAFKVLVEVKATDGTLLDAQSKVSSELFNEKSFLERMLGSVFIVLGLILLLMLGIMGVLRKISVLIGLAIIMSFMMGTPADASSVLGVSAPFENQQVIAGETFPVEGTISVWQCRNEPTYYKISHSGLRLPDQTNNPDRYPVITTRIWNGDDGHVMATYNGNFRFNVTAPSTPGSYYICVGGSDWRTNGDGNVYEFSNAIPVCRYITVVQSLCGSAENSVSAEAPTSNLCNAPSTSSNMSSTNFQHVWSCTSSAGQERECSTRRCESGTIWNGSSCVVGEIPRAECNTRWDTTGSKQPPQGDRCSVGDPGPVTSWYSMQNGLNRWVHDWNCTVSSEIDPPFGSYQDCRILRCPYEQDWNPTTSTCEDVDTNLPVYTCGPTVDSGGNIFDRIPDRRCKVTWKGEVSYISSTGGVDVTDPSQYTWDCYDYTNSNSISCSAPRIPPNVDDINNCGIYNTGDTYWNGVACVAKPACGSYNMVPPYDNYRDELVVGAEIGENFNNFWGNTLDSHLCNSGVPVSKLQVGWEFLWSCAGSGVNPRTVSCSTKPEIAGICSLQTSGQTTSCVQGILDPNYPNDTRTHANFSCWGINNAPSETSCGFDCPAGEIVVEGECVPETIIPGACGTTRENECLNGGALIDSPADSTNQSRWTCASPNGGENSPTCRFNCPANYTVSETGICTPPNNACVPIITPTYNSTVVSDSSRSCSMNWTVTHTPPVCNVATTVCTLDGVVVNGAYNNRSIGIGTHTLTCTSTLNGQSWSTTLSPRPQCRLNPNYGEF